MLLWVQDNYPAPYPLGRKDLIENVILHKDMFYALPRRMLKQFLRCNDRYFLSPLPQITYTTVFQYLVLPNTCCQLYKYCRLKYQLANTTIGNMAVYFFWDTLQIKWLVRYFGTQVLFKILNNNFALSRSCSSSLHLCL